MERRDKASGAHQVSASVALAIACSRRLKIMNPISLFYYKFVARQESVPQFLAQAAQHSFLFQGTGW